MGERRLSTSDMLGVASIVVAIMSVALDLTGEVRAGLVFIALGLIVYAGRSHDSRPFVRVPIATVLILIFAFSPWGEIATDFRKEYPGVEWLMAAKSFWFHVALAFVFIIALLWRSLPAWQIGHGLFSSWRAILGEELWIDRESALKLIRASDWARLREPSTSVLEAFGSNLMRGGVGPADRSQIQFRHFIEMALRNFELYNSQYIRDVDGKREYLESKLVEFTQRALDDEVIEKFGKLPKVGV